MNLKNLTLLVLPLLITSCFTENKIIGHDLPANTISVDYYVDVKNNKSFTVIKNEIVTIQKAEGFKYNIVKYNNKGEVRILKKDIISYSYPITTSFNDDKLFYVIPHENKIYSYSLSTSRIESHTMTNPTAILTQIVTYKDKIVIYDSSSNTFRQYLPDLNKDIFVAGNGLSTEIKDGDAINANFKNIGAMASVDNIIYFIDNKNNLRKMEEVNSQFKVSTIIKDYEGIFYNLTIDKNKNLLVSNGVGIYKFNTSNQTLEEYLNGEFRYSSDGSHSTHADWQGNWSYFKFEGNHLYYRYQYYLMKISNYEEKLEKLKNK